MEKKFYHTDFEELIKEKADQYKMYPSDRVWKGIDRAIRSRRKWYWSGFVLLLSGVSYLAITELMSPATVAPVKQNATTQKPLVTAQQLNPLTASSITADAMSTPLSGDEITSDLLLEDDGNVTAAFEIPLKLLPGAANVNSGQKASLRISGLAPLGNREQYNFELSWPESGINVAAELPQPRVEQNEKVVLHPQEQTPVEEKVRINWLLDNAAFRVPTGKTKRISWQLAFSPTVNYRKLTGSRNAKTYYASTPNIPLALRLDGNVGNLVNHKPALGFELGTHGHMMLNNRFTFKAGLQFNYSKYDIRAFRAPAELTTIALNSQTGNTIVGVSDIRNFGGTTPADLKNQYFQLSMPVGFEFRVLGNENLQLNLASTLQPTYLLNSNTYLITTDFKNYAKEPSLVRKWNVNAGAEAFIAYARGGVKWQVGPQFRYQLLSSYKNEYPIKEYLMEYGIKVGITKTIR